MKQWLLQVSAAVEFGAGAALLLWPSIVVAFLFGGTLESPAALAVARIAGAALVALGMTCWFASRDSRSKAAAGVVISLTFYNAAAVGTLLFMLLGANLSGMGTWPAILGHVALAAWCLVSLRTSSP